MGSEYAAQSNGSHVNIVGLLMARSSAPAAACTGRLRRRFRRRGHDLRGVRRYAVGAGCSGVGLGVGKGTGL